MESGLWPARTLALGGGRSGPGRPRGARDPAAGSRTALAPITPYDTEDRALRTALGCSWAHVSKCDSTSPCVSPAGSVHGQGTGISLGTGAAALVSRG